VDTASLTPRDKENAGANSTRNSSQSEYMDFPKASSTHSSTADRTTPSSVPAQARTPSKLRFPNQAEQQALLQNPIFFTAARTSSPASFSSDGSGQHQQPTSNHPSPVAAVPQHSTSASSQLHHHQHLLGQKSPPGTSQVLRKHFQSLGFATPPGKQRMLSSGAVRTPNPHVIKGGAMNPFQQSNKRVGIDGTKYTPSKELLKSTTSSRHQRLQGLQDLSMDQQQHTTMLAEQDQQQQDSLSATSYHDPISTMMDDETSTVASGATMDDASFDMSLPSMTMNHSYTQQQRPLNPFPGISSSLLLSSAPMSPLTPRTGCRNPVAMTLLNDGGDDEEDYEHDEFTEEQDSWYPIPALNTTDEQLAQGLATTTCSSRSSSTASTTSSPCRSVPQSPAPVRGTLPPTVRSSLAYPVAMMPKSGRTSPSTNASAAAAASSSSIRPRLLMRPQAKHVR